MTPRCTAARLKVFLFPDRGEGGDLGLQWVGGWVEGGGGG